MNKQAGALFAGIVAVGLGPAVWLGGTLFRADPVPAAPAPVSTPDVTVSATVSEPAEESPSPEPSEDPGTEELDPDGLWVPPGSGHPAPPPTARTPKPSRSASPSASAHPSSPPAPSGDVTPSAVG